ncbi:hypothetical protein LWP59_29875 [Amycolatopsis acidiphila]|uniref:Secreted protein n=1 Tax=Amycolatopsis acidiphila TaxID=715473 RepID=A0A557ZVC2_9PSEU|nr:hypothetical protein [Amycolatopsis acidiphila]TVT15971.1 hypothetical protein FNH06_35465 [Amycolatopsis acidiphila]UIJ58302.1 hypothetical protein LWP59_29875 [Amycolatopsis acidiphila]GHG95721.1 hypothetical protein GCM10017788_74450 [Amycolatopsis acidiphila]
MRRAVAALFALLLASVFLAPAAEAAPGKLTASDFRLRESAYNPVISKLDGILGTVPVSAVLDSANRTGVSCNPGATHQAAAFCWNSGDNDTTDWYPQGISTTADAYDNGQYEGRTALFTSWYYAGTGTNKGVRVSFVDYSTPSTPQYRHVLLVEPYTNSAGQPDYRPVAIHAGGIFTYGYYLYVADTSGGFRTFDLRHIWSVKTGDNTKIGRQSDGSYQAFDYAYVLPQAQTFTDSTTNGLAQLRFSAASLDRTSTPDSVVVPEYNTDGTGTRVVRFPIDYTDRKFAESSDGYTHATEAYQVNIPSMQGATAINGTFYVSASAGSGTRGSLWTFTSSSGPTKHATVFPIGNEDLSYRGPQNQLWTLSEYPGSRYVVAVTPSSF